MSNLYLNVLPPEQLTVWRQLQAAAAPLQQRGFYLAGGTALAIQCGHRQSIDFDFFSQQADTAEPMYAWLQEFSGMVLREMDPQTVHAELNGVKVSFIGRYRYPVIEPLRTIEALSVASIADIGTMKLLAITHRATLRDYLDLALIIRDYIPLSTLLQLSQKKYGVSFNTMVPLKALVSFAELEQDVPPLLDTTLAATWRDVLTKAVKDTAG
jgi:hypothetical protein